MGTLVTVQLSLTELTALIDLLEEAQDKGIELTEHQLAIYKHLQNKEAEEIMSGSN